MGLDRGGRRTGARVVPTKIAARLGGDIDDALGEIGVPTVILDRSGMVRWQNAAAIEVFGDRRGKHFLELVAPEGSAQARDEFAKQILGTTSTSDTRVVLRGSDGGRFPAEVHTVALTDGRRVVGVFGFASPRRDQSAPPVRGDLTPRQYEVLRALGGGASTDQIAAALHVSRETVRNHVRAILRHLDVHSRLEAVVEAQRRGLLP